LTDGDRYSSVFQGRPGEFRSQCCAVGASGEGDKCGEEKKRAWSPDAAYVATCSTAKLTGAKSNPGLNPRQDSAFYKQPGFLQNGPPSEPGNPELSACWLRSQHAFKSHAWPMEARSALERGDSRSAERTLDDFMTEVEAKRRNSLTDHQADVIVDRIQNLARKMRRASRAPLPTASAPDSTDDS